MGFTNTDPAMIAFFCAWLRQFFDIDEQRMRARLYLHEGLDLTTAMSYWRALTRIPESQFLQPYRAPADATRRRAKHTRGCLTITYSCSRTHREIMGLLKALLALPALRTPDASATQDCW